MSLPSLKRLVLSRKSRVLATQLVIKLFDILNKLSKDLHKIRHLLTFKLRSNMNCNVLETRIYTKRLSYFSIIQRLNHNGECVQTSFCFMLNFNFNENVWHEEKIKNWLHPFLHERWWELWLSNKRWYYNIWPSWNLKFLRKFTGIVYMKLSR